MKNLFLVINPESGMGRIKTELFKVCDMLTRGGYRITLLITTKKGDATEAVSQLDDTFDAIVVCGGDGTLNEVITGVMQNPNTYKIGYIPSGTLNEWSAGLEIPRRIPKATEGILSGNEIALDIGKFKDSYFSYTASFGAFTAASYSTPQNIKNVFGQVAYVLEGIRELGTIKPIHMKFTSDDEVYEGNYLFGAVSNAMSVGGIIKFEEGEVALNDGVFEVLLIEEPEKFADLNQIIDAIVTRTFNCKCIKRFKTRHLTVESQDVVDWTLDGEHAQSQGIIDIINLHNAIKFIVP